jgi:hypothetical protein
MEGVFSLVLYVWTGKERDVCISRQVVMCAGGGDVANR